ncbi:MAG TPA: ATP-dependent Clp protease proteolytic subunit [Gemmatimonadaceae bacterium]
MEQIERDIARDYFMSAEEAKNYGIIDQVIQSRGDLVDTAAAQAAFAASAETR